MKYFSLISVALAAFEANAQCSVCSDGSAPNTSLDKCPEIASDSSALTAGSEECKSNQLKAFQNSCCSTAPTFCTLCPDGAGFNAGKAVPNPKPGSDDLTCADLNGQQAFLDSIFEDGTCSDTLLQRSAAWCECPDISRECNLCLDGSNPSEPNRVDSVLYGWNCEFFEFVSSFFSADDCPKVSSSGDILTIDAAAFCGCPGTTAPNVCNLCAKGEVVRSEVDLGPFTCGELSRSTSYINSLTGCVTAKARFRDRDYIESCCFDPSDLSSAVAIIGRFSLVLALILALRDRVAVPRLEVFSHRLPYHRLFMTQLGVSFVTQE
eukprot:scaffold909_cov135-Cylindrotheca_fusiformis.AAC.23